MAATFRAGVIIVVEHSDGSVLSCERGDIAGAWQLPQGGIDEGESPVAAAWRELEEETGLTSAEVQLSACSDDWTLYELPQGHGLGRHLGQAHRWFRFVVTHDSVQPTVDGNEFVNWSWMRPSDLVDVVADFRRAGYEAMLLNDDGWHNV